MDSNFRDIIIRFRDYLSRAGYGNITLDELSVKIDVPKDVLLSYVTNEEELIVKVLEFEREQFEEIFKEYDFEGVNAIDILLTVSKEMARRFKNLSPSITFDLKKHYPEIYQTHFKNRIDFIYDKIKINLTKGISQGIYRDDLSIELVARLYLSRLIDLHDPVFFPPDKFSFETLFDVMFENFVRAIANSNGIAYFEKRKKQYHL